MKSINERKKYGNARCRICVIILLAFLMPFMVFSQRKMEKINRGLVAVKTGGNVYVGWRMFGTDPDTIGFDLYRITDGAVAEKLNSDLIKNTTNYVDNSAVLTSSLGYYVVPVIDGVEQEASDTVVPWSQQYLSIPLNIPPSGTTPPYTVTNRNVVESYPDGQDYTYTANDASVGDLDGDGEYEIVLKWDPTNSRDNAFYGITGNTILDAYEMDGTQLWRIDLGVNIRAGAHYTQFMVFDLDGDGTAEVACKTAPGSKDGTGSFLSKGPAFNDNDSVDYRTDGGAVITGPEYLTVFNGSTGEEITTVGYIPLRNEPYSIGTWGDPYGNTSERYLATVAYFDSIPSLVMCRGYYLRTALTAWDFDGDSLKMRWAFDTETDKATLGDYQRKGNHQLSVADVDFDGKDEIVYGSICIDDDGTGLWTTGLGHGDAMHVSDIIPDRYGMEKWGVHEGSDMPGGALLDAKTGEIIWATPVTVYDVGRGCSADLDSTYIGMECWGGTDGLRSSVNNVKVGRSPNTCNHVVWWDGDLLREILDSYKIYKYRPSETYDKELLVANGCSSNNSTKSNPALQADLFGDWREEVIWRTSDNASLRIYTTVNFTKYKIPTLMHDPVYRVGVAWQNVAYNQPPHTSFYLGVGMFIHDSARPPSAPIGLYTKASMDFVQLYWSKNNEDDLAGYNMYKSDSVNGNYTLQNYELITGLTYRDSSIILDNQYYYYITAVDSNGNESNPSAKVMELPTLRPEEPFGINVRNGYKSAFVFWNKASDEGVVGYNVYRSDKSGLEYVKVNDVIVTDTFYLNDGISDNVKYYYVVTSVDDADMESFYSEEKYIIPGKIVNIQAEDANILSGVFIDSNHVGFNGTGFVNFDASSHIQFDYVYGQGRGGWYWLVTRHTLGVASRTGEIIVNDSVLSYTMKGTTEWTNFIYDSAKVYLEKGFANTIKFASTGADFGNLDEIIIRNKAEAPVNIDPKFFYSDYDGIKISPNPFKEKVYIAYSCQKGSNLKIDVLNNMGQTIKIIKPEIVDNYVRFNWDGTNSKDKTVPYGIYFIRIISDNSEILVRRVVFVK